MLILNWISVGGGKKLRFGKQNVAHIFGSLLHSLIAKILRLYKDALVHMVWCLNPSEVTLNAEYMHVFPATCAIQTRTFQ